jgi:hypothetical protein
LIEVVAVVVLGWTVLFWLPRSPAGVVLVLVVLVLLVLLVSLVLPLVLRVLPLVAIVVVVVGGGNIDVFLCTRSNKNRYEPPGVVEAVDFDVPLLLTFPPPSLSLSVQLSVQLSLSSAPPKSRSTGFRTTVANMRCGDVGGEMTLCIFLLVRGGEDRDEVGNEDPGEMGGKRVSTFSLSKD